MTEKQNKRILPQLFSCIQKQKDITVITLLTIRKYQSITFCIIMFPYYIYTYRVIISYKPWF